MLEKSDLKQIREIMTDVVTRSEARIINIIDEKIEQSEARIINIIDDKITQSENRVLEEVNDMINNSENTVMLSIQGFAEPKFSKIDKELSKKVNRTEIYDWVEKRFVKL